MRWIRFLSLLVVVAPMVSGAGFLLEALDSGELEWISLGVLPPEEEHERDHEDVETEDSDSDELLTWAAPGLVGPSRLGRLGSVDHPPESPPGKRFVPPPERLSA
jgi:hypothetical protein